MIFFLAGYNYTTYLRIIGKLSKLFDGYHGVDERKELFVPLGQFGNSKPGKKYFTPNLSPFPRFGGF